MAGPLDNQRGSKDPPTPPPQGYNFTEGQLAQLRQIVGDLLVQGRRTPPAAAPQPESSASVKPSDIGYFYPNMPWDWGELDVIEKEGKVYYRNVFSFTNRIRVAAQTRDLTKLKASLDACFRGEAELW